MECTVNYVLRVISENRPRNCEFLNGSISMTTVENNDSSLKHISQFLKINSRIPWKMILNMRNKIAVNIGQL